MEQISEIHHISAIVGNIEENYSFYHEILKLKLVKQTVNYDDPSQYHLYFANQMVEKGTSITFFPLENSKAGKKGSGQVGRIVFRIPSGSLNYWQERLLSFHIPLSKEILLDRPALFFQDYHALELAPVEVKQTSETDDILGFDGAYLLSHDFEGSKLFLTEMMGLLLLENQEKLYILETNGTQKQKIYLPKTNFSRGNMGPGTVHHIAWQVSDLESLKHGKTILEKAKLNVTNIRDRTYFQSIYFRETGKVIFELATEGPGFIVDESWDHLGKQLQLPKQLEKKRQEIMSRLAPFKLGKGESNAIT